jgi:hypothetical protein
VIALSRVCACIGYLAIRSRDPMSESITFADPFKNCFKARP